MGLGILYCGNLKSCESINEKWVAKRMSHYLEKDQLNFDRLEIEQLDQ